MTVGRHNGTNYRKCRICDVLCVPIKARWWFVCDPDGEPTADHFRTLADLKAFIDSRPGGTTLTRG